MVSGDEGRKIEKRMVVEYGITLDGVWLPLAMLRRLTAHGLWGPPLTEATADQERVSSCTLSLRGTTRPACTAARA